MAESLTIDKPVNKQDDCVNLFSVGCLFNLNIGTWSGRKMLTRADFVNVGLDPDALPEEIVNYGRKLLVPKTELQKINQIEQKARAYLAKWSVPFGISKSHFVPVSMLPSVNEQLTGLKEDFFEAVDSFVTRFEEMKNTIKERHPDFWEKCLRTCYPPNPKMLRDKFHFQWYTFRIAGLGYVEEANIDDLVAAEEVKQERKAELKNQMQNEVGEFVKEYVDAMREETVKFCDLMSARINGKPHGDEEHPKKLTPRSLSYFRKYIDKFKQFNIFGDNEIEKMLKEFREHFLGGDAVTKDFENSHIKKSVTDALATIRRKATAHDEQTSKFVDGLKRKVVI